MLFAEQDSFSAFGLILQGGAFGLLAYLVIYGIPSWIKEFREERRAERVEREAERREREADRTERENDRNVWIADFRADREQDRDADDKRHAALLSYFTQQNHEERETCERRHGEGIEATRAVHRAVDEGMKETRHSINNLAQIAELKRTLKERGGDAQANR
jgi:ABC-type nickel/cobalt efflux system permease component RcnA